MKTLPFDGVRVADLSMMWAGPYATKLLAELGAEVLKIESPSAWDNIRTLIPFPDRAEPWNSSYYFNTYNRGKKSVTLDLAQAKGRAVFLELLAHCDVLIENYRADVLDKLQLPYDVLREANPQLVIVSMAGFGKTGADRSLVGFGPVIEMMSGLTSLTGYVDDEVPYKCGVSYGDPVAGVAAASAVAMGLLQRRRSGKAPIIDLAQREVAATFAGGAFVAAQRDPAVRHHGNRHPQRLIAPRGAYRCRDEVRHRPTGAYALIAARDADEQWIAISALDDAQWAALAGLIGREELAGLSLAERAARHDELDDAIAAWAATQEAGEAVGALQDAGVAAARVLDMVAIHDDPQLRARRFWRDLPHPDMPVGWLQPGASWRFVEADTSPTLRAPLFGEHTREVLSGLLGYDEAALAELEAAHIIADAPINPGVG
ncbi:MAG: CaiB/BaiF CoA transferase family protein [Acidimicrobiia bacterium]